MTFQRKGNNSRLAAELTEVIRSGALHHAYILEGPQAANKAEFAKDFTQAILCREKPGIGCGKCAVCRKIEDGNHLDLICLEATSKSGTKTKSIKSEDIIKLQERLLTKPGDGGRNIAVIKDADRVTREAYNKLLKTLEEPPLGTVIMLLSENADVLPQTIRSRAVHLRLRPEEKSSSDKMRSKAAGLKELIDERAPYHQIRKSVETVTKGRDFSREMLSRLLDDLEEMYRDDLLQAHSRMEREEIFHAIEAVEAARKEAKENINTSYSLKNMALTIGGDR
ncbi:MAG: hypothetical protein ACOX4I_08170 [Anaerovoracaceae bacterium]|jgi:DNA polymerase-3 subunit delta'